MSLKLRLGINTGFAINRFPEPEEWIRIVGNLGLRYVQFTADMLNPHLPAKIIREQLERINKNLIEYDVLIEHTFTGAFTRVNHLAHPDKSIRRYWMAWFEKFADMSKNLGAISMGSHFGIYGVRDMNDKKRKEIILKEIIRGWRGIASYGEKIGLQYLTWEPMSIPREFGETISETKRIQKAVNNNIAIPMKLCLDVGHSYVLGNRDDNDPYAWLRAFGKEAPMVHIKQQLPGSSAHWPFTKENNAKGTIKADKVIEALEASGAKDVLLLFEFAFREREPFESRVVSDLKESVEYWREYVSD